MDVVTTANLEALLDRASGHFSSNPDMAAIEAFWSIIKKERDGPCIGVRLLAQKISSSDEKESLQALNVLDACMKYCGPLFHAEVGKFRFLNELIKIVSPKYFGTRTSPLVRNKILHLMHIWMKEYPRETKIKEAFEMLKKQGVIREDAYGNITPILTGFASNPIKPPQNDSAAFGNKAQTSDEPKVRHTIFEDEEKTKLLKKLLRSKNPDDLQAANRLIKTMVREEEKRSELINRRSTELQTVHNNARLLNEMLDSYRPDQTSDSELELIKELHQSCERLRPAVFKLASETQHNEEMLTDLTNCGGTLNLKRFWALAKEFDDVLEASVALGEVFEKYKFVIIQGNIITESRSTDTCHNSAAASSVQQQQQQPQTSGKNNETKFDTLLDLNTPVEKIVQTSESSSQNITKAPSEIDVLSDIFNNIDVSSSHPLADNTFNNILQPISLHQTFSKSDEHHLSTEQEKNNNRQKALEELDVLGATLLKESLAEKQITPNLKKSNEKISLNMLTKTQPINFSAINKEVKAPDREDGAANFDLDYLLNMSSKTSTNDITPSNGHDNTIISLNEGTTTTSLSFQTNVCEQQSSVVEKQIANINSPAKTGECAVKEDKSPKQTKSPIEIKSLNDIHVTIESIQPGNIPPLTVLEKNDISIVLHFAKDTPRPDVSVIVVSTISKSNSSLSDYLFQAVIKPKTCKLKLQPPSDSKLPAHNPFLPPAAITQVLLIANPEKHPISLNFMISYTMDDETITEMGEVDKLPLYDTVV